MFPGLSFTFAEASAPYRSLVGSQPALSWPCALQRGLQTSAALQEDVRVQVPSMGDSVSEGTVIEFPKKTGLFGLCAICNFAR